MTDPEKFKGKYRISSARWAAWDYSSNAAYFITICVAGRAHDFGEINNDGVKLSPLGRYTQDCWYAIPAHFPFVELGEFVVMPNHVHGIIIINKSGTDIVETHNNASGVGTHNNACIVETQNFASLRSPNQPRNRFGPQSQNLASIVRGYKIGVTKFARQNAIPFAWQARYHDRVIRDAKEYERIHLYILANPQNWEKDEFHAA